MVLISRRIRHFKRFSLKYCQQSIYIQHTFISSCPNPVARVSLKPTMYSQNTTGIHRLTMMKTTICSSRSPKWIAHHSPCSIAWRKLESFTPPLVPNHMVFLRKPKKSGPSEYCTTRINIVTVTCNLCRNDWVDEISSYKIMID